MNLRRGSAAIIVAGVFGILASAGTAQARAHGDITYRVKVQNVTAGNVLSPFIASVSPSNVLIAPLGTEASPGIARLAETGDRTRQITGDFGRGLSAFRARRGQQDAARHAGASGRDQVGRTVADHDAVGQVRAEVIPGSVKHPWAGLAPSYSWYGVPGSRTTYQDRVEIGPESR